MVINHFGMILQVGSVVSCTFLGFDRTKDANSKTPTRLFPRHSFFELQDACVCKKL